MNEEQKFTYKKILLQTMKDFIEICNNNNIEYIAAYGTVLGTVRHKGLIPWDDDIDVYMTRDNYQNFLNLKSKLIDTKYEILDYYTKNYYLPYAKFSNKNTTIWEKKELPCIVGVFIDIFPLDEVSINTQEVSNLKKQYRKTWDKYYYRYIRKQTTKTIVKDLFEFKLLNIAKYIFNNTIGQLFRNIVFKHFLQLENEIKKIKGEKFMYYATHTKSLEKSTYPKSWIYNTIEMPFENFKIRIPKQYDQYLKQEYGNYMQLPPKEYQISHHFHYYVNLEQRLKIDEIIKMNCKNDQSR